MAGLCPHTPPSALWEVERYGRNTGCPAAPEEHACRHGLGCVSDQYIQRALQGERRGSTALAAGRALALPGEALSKTALRPARPLEQQPLRSLLSGWILLMGHINPFLPHSVPEICSGLEKRVSWKEMNSAGAALALTRAREAAPSPGHQLAEGRAGWELSKKGHQPT